MNNNLIFFLVSQLMLFHSAVGKVKNDSLQVFSGIVELHNDIRQIYLEFDTEDRSTIRWSIEQSGRNRLPLINVKFNNVTNIFSGKLSFFGNTTFGSIQGLITENGVKGHMIWHNDTIPLFLHKSFQKLPYSEEEMVSANTGIKLTGTLIVPKNGKGPFPTVVFAHGSGSAWRWWGMYWAAELANVGVASYLHDKRGCGASGGDWQKSSLDDLAFDIISIIKTLEKHPSVDKEKIGVYGISQGGWLAGKVNAMYESLAFIIVNSGGGISPSAEELFSYDINMKFSGVNENDRKAALTLVRKYLNYLGSGIGRKELIDSMRAAENKSWYPILGLEKVMVSPKNRVNWEWVAKYNPLDDISKIKVPVLLMFGSSDHVQPTKVSVDKWEQGLKAASNTAYQVNIFDDAGHGLAIGGHHAPGFPSYAESHIAVLQQWLIKNVVNK